MRILAAAVLAVLLAAPAFAHEWRDRGDRHSPRAYRSPGHSSGVIIGGRATSPPIVPRYFNVPGYLQPSPFTYYGQNEANRRTYHAPGHHSPRYRERVIIIEPRSSGRWGGYRR